MTARWSVLSLVALLWGCAGVPGDDGGIEKIPPVPAGFALLESKPATFRSAEVKAPEGTWTVNYETEEGIVIVTGAGKRIVLPYSWYPQEGGADAAWTRGYRKGDETLIRLEGGNDFLLEETRFFFSGGELREAVKYSLPGPGHGPEWPGTPVPADKRVTRQSF